MATFVQDTDILVHIFGTTVEGAIGQASKYAQIPHPGTNKQIEGWKWDQRYWPTTKEFDATALVPSLWDPLTSGIEDTQWQSGYGDNNDIKLVDILNIAVSGVDRWSPLVNHGYFYIEDEEWYLFSDSFLTEYFSTTGLDVENRQVLQLTHRPKPTIPIQVRAWGYDDFEGRHIVDKDFRKVLEFQTSGEDIQPEFILSLETDPPTITLNGDWTEEVGFPITLTVSGEADPALVSGLELLGVSEGLENFEAIAEFSPFDPDADVQVWTWTNPAFPQQWSGLETWEDFDASPSLQVKIDRDRGAILFGNYNAATDTGGGKVPPLGHKIGIYYTKGIAVQYEPANTRDFILAYDTDADINPVTSATDKGFIHVATKSVEPASITLTSTLPQINPFLIELGNNIGEVIATVKTAAGIPLEGQEVTFEILEPQVGTFGATATTITAITNADGEARALYNAPATVQQLGRTTVDVLHDGGSTIMEVAGLIDPGTVSGLFIYKIHAEDEVLGLPASGEDQYWQDYLSDINATTGATATEDWEKEFRTTHDLERPTFYQTGDILTGKKSILLTQKEGVVNPKTGLYDSNTFSPLYPASIEDIGSAEFPVLKLVYEGNLDLPGTSDTKAYFAIGDSTTNLQAKVSNQRTGKVLRSNAIGMRVQVPETVNGTFFCDVLNEVPVGLLTKAKDVDLLSDAAINATSGIDDFWDDYIIERSRPGQIIPAHRVRYAISQRREILTDDVDLTFRLKEGGSTIATWSETSVPDSMASGLYQLSTPEALSITDYTNLQLEIDADTTGTGTATAQVHDVRLDINPNYFDDVVSQSLYPISDYSRGDWDASPWKLIQTAKAAVSGQSTVDISLPQNPTPGNLLVMVVAQGDNNYINGVLHLGVVWQVADQRSGTTPNRASELWYSVNVPIGASKDLTVLLNDSDETHVIVAEFSGADTNPASIIVDSGGTSTLIGPQWEAWSLLSGPGAAGDKGDLFVGAAVKVFSGFNCSFTEITGKGYIADQLSGIFGLGTDISTVMMYRTHDNTNEAARRIEVDTPDGFGVHFYQQVQFKALTYDLYPAVNEIDENGRSNFIFADRSLATSTTSLQLDTGLDPRRTEEFEEYLHWFRRTRRGDTVGLTVAAATVPDETLSGLDTIPLLDCPAEIPLGFRLKSTGVTVASVLDQITFIDPNDHLPSGYFDV